MVLLEDVATVSREAVPQWTRVTADGHDAVLFQVYQQPGGNTVQIQRQLGPKLAELQQRLPPDVRIANWYDQSEIIVSSAGSVRDAVLIGVVLAAVVMLGLSAKLKVTLIAMIAVPTVLATTILLLSMLHMSFNIMTLGGMAAAVGLIVDDAIVMIEHILRRLQSGTGDFDDRITRAVAELTSRWSARPLSTIIIFAPLAFLSGVTGAFFKALSLTMAASLADLVWRRLACRSAPGASAVERTRRPTARGRRAVRLDAHLLRLVHAVGVAAAVDHAVRHRRFARPWAGSAIKTPAPASCPRWTKADSFSTTAPLPARRLPRRTACSARSKSILRDTPEVQTYSRRTGLQLGGGLTEANEGDFFIRLKPLPRRDIEQVIDEVRERVESSIPGSADRDAATHGGSDRRPDGGAAAHRDQVVFRRRPAVARTGPEGRRSDRQDRRRRRRQRWRRPGRRCSRNPRQPRTGRTRRHGGRLDHAGARRLL